MRQDPRRPTVIALDASALSPGGAGIGRYLAALLPRMMRLAGDQVAWHLYARDAEAARASCVGLAHRVRADRMPVHAGRVLSLFSSQPVWLRRDRPDVFWAPAHRLPFFVPSATASVLTVHDLCWLKAPHTMRRTTRWLDRALMGPAVARADAVIAVSRATAHDLVERFPAVRDRVSVIHEAAERLPGPEPREALDARLSTERYFLFVGTAEPRKNLVRLLEAYAEAARRLPDFPRLVLVGRRGWGEASPREAARRLGLGTQVVFVGDVTDAALASLYAHAVAVVMPSLYEGFGLPLVEAMAHGTPVLTSDVAAMREIAGDAGLLVDPTSVVSIAQGLGRLASDEGLRARLARAATARGREFDWDRAAADTLAVLLRAARGRPCGDPGGPTQKDGADQ